ncbi:hypothetical protein GCM10022289_00350 [Pedobacter jeongneungensis]|uniref:Antimicrobial peptide system SdpA family protein n=1 Tax=Pedobacter jeongneungensis TaxID=947309 RepID=A0ABP8B1A8_9SPHI
MGNRKKGWLGNENDQQISTIFFGFKPDETEPYQEDEQEQIEPAITGLSLIFLVLVIFSAIVLYCVMTTSLQTPFNTSSTVKRNTFYFLPQGWAFFTRDAREEKLWAYKRTGNGSLIPLSPSGGSFIYLFGINREGRKLTSDYNRLLSGIDSALWKHIDFDLTKIAVDSRQKTILHIKNKDETWKAKGEVVFVKKKLTPWAWSHFESVKMPSKYVRIFID